MRFSCFASTNWYTIVEDKVFEILVLNYFPLLFFNFDSANSGRCRVDRQCYGICRNRNRLAIFPMIARRLEYVSQFGRETMSVRFFFFRRLLDPSRFVQEEHDQGSSRLNEGWSSCYVSFQKL